MTAVAKPFWSVRDTASGSFFGFFEYFERVSSIQQENENLRNQLYELRVRESEFNQIKQEYADLKAIMNVASSSPLKRGDAVVTARVLSKPPFTPYDTFLVDGGSDDGILLGDMVYANEALVIGRVTRVTPHTTHVTLFSSGGQTQEFSVSRTGTSVVVMGQGGGNFALYLPKDFDIEVGDTLSEPSYDAGIVATVYAIDETMQNSFKRVYARVPKAIFQSKFVLIGEL
jgi:cell shape-determining protein MreC